MNQMISMDRQDSYSIVRRIGEMFFAEKLHLSAGFHLFPGFHSSVERLGKYALIDQF